MPPQVARRAGASIARILGPMAQEELLADPPPKKRNPFAPLAIRDFRVLWIGAFVSFMGSWVQTVAQGWLVFELTGDEHKLAMVAFCSMIPVSIFGPIAGTITDVVDRRKVLVITQMVFAASAAWLAWANHMGVVQYEFVLIAALVNGFASTIEMPARQSLIATVVPRDLVASAVPLQAGTFNLARIVGPALGGVLLARFGPQSCYLVNALTYSALIISVLSIKANLSATSTRVQPIKDLLLEGILYTWREPRLKRLFLMETTVSVFGLAYIPFIPAFAKEVMGFNAKGLSLIYTMVGIGAISGLLMLISVSHRPFKGIIVRAAMTALGLALLALSFTREPWVVYALFALCGFATITQFNTTNTLFQLIAPERLRGRVLAMHIWALSGSAPLALPLLGSHAKNNGVPSMMILSGSVVVLGAIMAWLTGQQLSDPKNSL